MEGYLTLIKYVVGRVVILSVIGGVAAGILHDYYTVSPAEQRVRDKQQEIKDLRYQLDSLRRAREEERRKKDAMFVKGLTEIVNEL